MLSLLSTLNKFHTPERRHSRCYVVFIVTFEQILCIVTVFTLFKQINAGWEVYKRPDLNDFAKFRWSHAIVPSWVRKVFLWVLRGFRIFSHGYFVGLKFFLLGISWVQDFFTWVFRGSKIFSRRYFAGQRFFLLVISWAQNFMIFNKLQ